MKNYKLVLKNCAFYAYHGALPQEKKLGQRFFVDAVFYVLSDSYKDDKLKQTLDYGKAFVVIEKVVKKKSYNLIEKLAWEIGKALCEKFKQLQSAEITVRKPSVPIDGILDYVETTICYKK